MNNTNNKTRYYIPKKHSTHTFSRFISQFIDKNDWGKVAPSKDNHKPIKRHSFSKDYINYNLSKEPVSSFHTLKRNAHYTYYPLLKDILGNYIKDKNGKCMKDDPIYITKESCIESHLNACKNKDKSGYIYYTNSPEKDYNMICLDIDHESVIPTKKDVDMIVSFLDKFFGGCYYDLGSSGQSLHYYVIIHFNDVLDRFFIEDSNEGQYRNNLYSNLSSFLSQKINILNDFNLHFCGVRSNCPIYTEKTFISKLGNICKLPIVDDDTAMNLYHSKVFNENYLNKILDLPINKPTHLHTITTNDPKKGQVLVKVSKNKGLSDFEERNTGEIYLGIKDSFIMTRLFVQDYYRFYYNNHKDKPDLAAVMRIYDDMIGIKDKKREETIKNIFIEVDKSFDSKKLYKKRENNYYLGMYYVEIEKENLVEKFNILDNRRIRKEDIDIALGYIIGCFLYRNDSERKDRISKTGLKGRYIEIQEKSSIKIPKYQKDKVNAIFKMLMKLEYIEKINGQWLKGKWGMKYKKLDKLTKLNEKLKIFNKDENKEYQRRKKLVKK